MKARVLPAGFSLVELLVAVAVFAVVALLAWGGLDQLLRSRLVLDSESAAFSAFARGVGQVERELRQAAPRPIRDGDGRPVPALVGGGDGLEFTRFVGDGGWHTSSPGLERLAWRCIDGRLERLRWAALDRGNASAPHVEVVIEGIEDCRWRYLDAGGARTEWPVAADAGERLPLGVEWRFRTRAGEYRRVVELPASGPAQR